MMNFARQVIFIIIACLGNTISYAKNAADDLAQRLTNLKSMQANFEQQVLDGKGQIIQHSSGKFALLRPGKFRWETLQPTKQLLIADGTKIWIYDQGLQQVTVQKQDNRSATSPAMLLSGSVSILKKNFRVTYLKNSNANITWFVLQPVSHEAMFQTVKINFNAQQLQGMHLVDNLGQASVLTFTHVINNPVLSTNLFTFKVPKDVDIINQVVSH